MKFPQIKHTSPVSLPTPAKLSMEEYLDHISVLLEGLDLKKAYKFKRSEAHIKTPFRIKS